MFVARFRKISVSGALLFYQKDLPVARINHNKSDQKGSNKMALSQAKSSHHKLESALSKKDKKNNAEKISFLFVCLSLFLAVLYWNQKEGKQKTPSKN